MLTWIKDFLTNETAFVGFVRAACLGLGTAVASGDLDVSGLGLPKSLGIVLVGLGGFIRAGEKNKQE